MTQLRNRVNTPHVSTVVSWTYVRLIVGDRCQNKRNRKSLLSVHCVFMSRPFAET